ncbi:hypothetical protein [Gaetbulibacter aestuarii]|uniref:Lipocalin-like domain-containing protein n=1 Tax=Gaetbulibacter aestuarii TaxID=1502358 RepID=A0ABW7MYX3_9FLAO
MKKLALFLLIGFFTLTSFKAPSALFGTWNIQKIINKKTHKQDNFLTTMSFKENDVFEASQGDLHKSGVWYYDENENMITVNVGQEDGHFKIKKLSKKKLVLENSESKMYLKK